MKLIELINVYRFIVHNGIIIKAYLNYFKSIKSCL